ncbi:MAG: hypothetical protein KJO07_05185, partial [Deltaproteobacteria bacterium]|nr:hypothetical protein [Deltaproteobacteria bacterium]
KVMEAISRRQRLLVDEPLVADHYRALRKLYARTKQYDRAWMACRSLAYLGHADEEESSFLAARMSQGYDMPSQRMTGDVWRLVRDPDEDVHVTAIFRMVAEAAALMNAVPQKTLGLDERVAGTSEFRNLVKAVSEVLDVAGPETFVHPGSAGEILWANARRGRALARTIAIGRDLCDRRDPRYLVASITKSLVYSRPEYFLRMAAANPQELEAIFLAASSLSRQDVPVPATQVGRVGTYRKHFDALLPGSLRRALAVAVDRYVAAGKAYDLVEWCRRVDSTARRAALLVAGDLELATAVGGGQVGEVEMASLLRHSVSDAHHAGRVHLGLAKD